MPHFGFIQNPDERDNKFPLSKVLKKEKRKLLSRFHKPGMVLNQGNYPHCVGYAAQQLLRSEPVPQKGKTGHWIYGQAKKIDEFGPGVEGTSIRAGLNVLKANKLITSYYWANDTEQIIDFLLRYGPVIVGTPWYSGMNQPKYDTGVVSITGKEQGGHAWLILGANLQTGYLNAINSWGSDYGILGQFRIHINQMQTLLNLGGVAAAAIEPGLIQ